MMSETEFKSKFIATFLASWVADHYDVACATGRHDQLYHFPIEDAADLANAAWEKFRDYQLEEFKRTHNI